jgi:hypothetical protein
MWVSDHALPRITFLSTGDLPRAIARVIGAASILPVVPVVAHQVAVNAIVPQYLGHRVIKWLKGAPTAVEKVVAPGMQLATCWHARHAANVAVLKGDRTLCQSLKVGGKDPLTAIWREKVAVERVKHDHDRLHGVSSSLLWSPPIVLRCLPGANRVARGVDRLERALAYLQPFLDEMLIVGPYNVKR